MVPTLRLDGRRKARYSPRTDAHAALHRPVDNRHIGWMTTYTVTAQSNPTRFSVEIVGNDGARQTMLGFTSQKAAEAWVAESKRHEISMSKFRMEWRF